MLCAMKDCYKWKGTGETYTCEYCSLTDNWVCANYSPKNIKEHRDAFYETFKSFCEARGYTVEGAIHIFRERMDAAKALERAEIRDSHASLVGKCYRLWNTDDPLFPAQYVYVKVVSEYSTSYDDVSCLCFSENPVYWFSFCSGQTGRFDQVYIYTDDISVDDLMDMEEVSAKEYDQAMHKMVDKLLGLEWIWNHNRTGGIWPTDEEWKKG